MTCTSVALRTVTLSCFALALAGFVGTARAGWRSDVEAEGQNFARAVRVDGAGDVLVGGNAGTGPIGPGGFSSGSAFSLYKLSGASGAKLWEFFIGKNPVIFTHNYLNAIASDAANDVIAVGELNRLDGVPGGFTVVKLSGVTGTQMWRYDIISAASNVVSPALAVVVDAGGNVIAAGQSQNNPVDIYDTRFTVVKLAGSSGTEIWRTDSRGARARPVTLPGGSRSMFRAT